MKRVFKHITAVLAVILIPILALGEGFCEAVDWKVEEALNEYEQQIDGNAAANEQELSDNDQRYEVLNKRYKIRPKFTDNHQFPGVENEMIPELVQETETLPDAMIPEESQFSIPEEPGEVVPPPEEFEQYEEPTEESTTTFEPKVAITTDETTIKKDTGDDLSDDIVIDVLELKNMDIMDILKLIADKSSLNIIAGKGVAGKVTIYLKDVKLKDALQIILDSNNLAYKVENGIIRVMAAKEFETRYGYVFGGNMQTKIIQLLYANVADLVAVLNQMKSPSGKVIFDMKSNMLVLMDSPEALTLMEKLIKEIDSPFGTAVFQLSYAKAKDIEEKIREVLTPNVGKVKSDERSNRIVVTDTRSKIDEVRQIIEAFDMKEEQVLIEAKIVQIVLSDQHRFGVDWEAIVRDYHNLDLVSDFDVLADTTKKGKLSIGTVDSDDYTVLIHALESVGTTNILSSPSITALNNQEAKILVGSTEPYVTTTTTIPASGPSTTAESINFIEVGVKLYVTPTIHEDHFITMKIKPEVSSVTRSLTTSNNNTIPVVETSEAETTVTIKDGITVVIGGLIKDEKVESTNKVPFLGDIPLLGKAFQNNDDLIRKTEIVIFLTPKIITGDVPNNDDVDFLSVSKD